MGQSFDSDYRRGGGVARDKGGQGRTPKKAPRGSDAKHTTPYRIVRLLPPTGCKCYNPPGRVW